MSKSNNSGIVLGAATIAALAFYYNKSTPVKGASLQKGKIVYNGVTDFVTKNYPYALGVQKAMQVPAAVNLTIAGVESGWGKHAIANNLHGIKADKSWKGEFTKVKTPECMPNANAHLNAETLSIVAPNVYGAFAACTKKGDYTYWINDKFRAYPSPAASFIDFGNFLHKYYKPAFNEPNEQDFGRYVLSHGYSTAQYVETFVNLVKQVQSIIDKL